MRPAIGLLLGTALLLLPCRAGPPAPAVPPPAGPLAPAQAVQAFRLADPELVIEPVAAEPDVVSPVAVAWDEDGRLYVAEMLDYPTGPPAGRIRLLEDPDEQGRYRKATIFADQLPFPSSVLPYKGGVFVTAAPHLWYLKDSDGDGTADQKRVVLTGFAEGNQQLRANGLTWGLDNWIHGANGRSSGRVRRPDEPAARAVSLNHHDFRFHPQTYTVEARAGFSQFGLARDDRGRRFLSWNTTPLRQVVLEEHYLGRNPYLASGKSVALIADPGDAGRLYPVSPPPATFNNEPVLYFNASCGPVIYRGEVLGPKYAGNLFVCEPLTNLVHRRELTPRGPTVLARRADKEKEFLASTDPWCHPVFLATGPDGCLYVVDFYRQWVEHPEYVPAALRPKVDWHKGAQHGRIWRLRPRNARPQGVPRLSRATTAELVRELGHANGWRRDTVQRLLVERQDTSAVALLNDVVRQAASPLAAVHALWTLEGLKALPEETLLAALRASDAGVRAQAVRLAEGRLGSSAPLTEAVRQRAEDPDAEVRFQAALALGEVEGKEVLAALARILNRDVGNEWVELAVLTGLKDRAWPLVQTLIDQDARWLGQPSEAQLRFVEQTAAVVGARNQEQELASVVRHVTGDDSLKTFPTRLALLAGLADGMRRAGRPFAALADAGPGLEEFLQTARKRALADEPSPFARVRMLTVLVRCAPGEAGAVVEALLSPEQPAAVQAAAARAVGELADEDLARRVLQGWGTYMVTTRRDLIAGLLRAPALAAVLVQALEAGTLAAADLDAAAREGLRRIAGADLQKRVGKLLANPAAVSRAAVLGKYQDALKQDGDARRGAVVFAKHCLSCHPVRGQGQRVGPDLSGVAGRPSAALLQDILDPSKEVAPDYRTFLLVTSRGQFLSGVLASETPGAVTLRQAGGAEEVVLRKEIQELRATGKSLMPEGFEQQISVAEMADLLRFLHRPGPLPAGE